MQRVNQTPNQVNEIGVRLKDYTRPTSLARDLGQIAPERVESWGDQNLNIQSVFAIQNALRFSMIMTVLIVAGFGIYNILNVTVTRSARTSRSSGALGYDTFDIILSFLLARADRRPLRNRFRTDLRLSVLRLPSNHYLHASHAQQSRRAICTSRSAPHLLSSGGASASLDLDREHLPARAAGKLTPIEIIRQGG